MSGSGSTISIKINADDFASKQIEAVKKQIEKLQAPSERASKGLGGLMDSNGVGKLAGGMRNVARESGAAFLNIGRMLPELGALSGAASVAGLAGLARGF